MLNQRMKIFSGVTTASLLFLVGASDARLFGQDAFGYTATNNVPFSYQNISSTGVAILSGADDGAAIIQLPFGFRYYGITYSSACVSTNGLVSFGSCVPNDFTNLDLTSQAPPGDQPLIAPLWMDLSFGAPGAGSVVYQTLGSPGSRQFVIQWNGVAALNVPGTLNFQISLLEGANSIIFQYQDVESGAASVNRGAGATVGIRDTNGHKNNRRIQWSFQAPVIKNMQAIQFTPPAATAPVDVSASVRVTTSAFVFNRLTQIYSGTVSVTNTGTSVLNRPLTIVLTNLTTGVTAVNASGSTATGPYYVLPGSTPLGPGQTVSVPVQFRNPSNSRISFEVKTYFGSF